MIETVVALLLIINGEIKEARIQTSMSECLKGSRLAKRDLKANSFVKDKQTLVILKRTKDIVSDKRKARHLIKRVYSQSW